MADASASRVGHPTDRLLGMSPAIAALRAQICHLASFDTVGNPHVPTVLLQGETGTGKGLVARVLADIPSPHRLAVLRHRHQALQHRDVQP